MTNKLSSNITKEMQMFIIESYPKMTHEMLATAFNEKFKTNYAHSYLKRKVVPAVYEQNGLLITDVKERGYNLKFRSSIKKVGTERFDKNAKTWIIKVSDCSTKKNKGWERKNRVMYEKYYGKIPEKHAIIFKNGDKNDFSKENLMAIPYNYLRFFKDLELIKDEEIRDEILGTILLTNKIYDKIREIKES